MTSADTTFIPYDGTAAPETKNANLMTGESKVWYYQMPIGYTVYNPQCFVRYIIDNKAVRLKTVETKHFTRAQIILLSVKSRQQITKYTSQNFTASLVNIDQLE